MTFHMKNKQHILQEVCQALVITRTAHNFPEKTEKNTNELSKWQKVQL
jgi:hypothetical protein